MRFEPRLRRLARAGAITVWRVDGHSVRNRLDIEFTNGAHHFHAPYVPEDEIWLDREARDAGEEWRHWLAYQTAHRQGMASGASYLEAMPAAERAEGRSRGRAARTRPARRSPQASRLARAARRRRLGVIDGREVVLVRGCLVREQAYLHFTLGGHALVYPFVPDGEVWIDDAVSPEERAAVLHHELVELELMARRGLDYHAAHARASSAEARFRRRGR